MSTNRIGQLAWGLAFFIGLFEIGDIGFGPIVICPKCGGLLNAVLGGVLMVVSAAALFTNRVTAAAR